MIVYIVWFEGALGETDLVEIFASEEKAKAYLKEHRTFGNEGLYLEEYEVEQ
jgi:hypothetical protein